jgi:predicted Zn finger-like uncharacterized protein
MIVICNNCGKKFEVNSNLITENGRLLQCGSCNHEWFFKKEILESANKPSINTETIDIKIPTVKKVKNDNEIKLNNEKDLIYTKEFNKEKKIKFKFLNLIIVFIISFISLIILIDTFKAPIGKIFPNTEFILYNLYESIKDIKLFLIDLI